MRAFDYREYRPIWTVTLSPVIFSRDERSLTELLPGDDQDDRVSNKFDSEENSMLTLAASTFALSPFAPAGGMRTASSARPAVFRMQVSAPPKDELKGAGDKSSFDTSIDEIPKCPITQWNSDNIDMTELKKPRRTVPIEIRHDAASGMSESESLAAQREAILAQLEKGGAIWFRGFELMKSKEGFQQFYDQLELKPCQDPLASVGARAVVSKKGAMYEAVNKPSRAKFFVGMHNESTFKRTNRLGAFVCFKAADKGGEFLLADGQAVLADLDKEVLGRLYDKGVRFSNAELPIFDFLRSAGPLKEPLMPVFKAVGEFAVAQKIDMELELKWAENDKDGLRLQAFSPAQSAVNRHPTTGEPAFFCNVHSHSRYLRDTRDAAVEGGLGETTGASKFNVTDMFYGDGSEIPVADLEHINEVIMKNLVYVPMTEGDVVLVDNYQVMHGRDVFEGERLHAVTWFQ